MFSPSRHTVHTIGDLHDCVILLRRPESLSKYFVIQIFLLSWEKNRSHCLRARRPIRPALISGFRSIKRLGVFILHLGWDASTTQGYPQHYAGTQLYTWVERGTVRVKCLAQEHNTMSPARPRTRTTRSGVERTNHEATALPTCSMFSASRHTVHTIVDLHDCVILIRRPESLSKYFVIQIFLLSWEKKKQLFKFANRVWHVSARASQ